MIKLNVCMSFCGMNGNDGSACVYQDDDDDVLFGWNCAPMCLCMSCIEATAMTRCLIYTEQLL